MSDPSGAFTETEPNESSGSLRAGVPQRDPRMDAVRGLAIILVVLGHAIYEAGAGATTDPVFRTIYAFHMPLFAVVSGYLYARGIERRTWPVRRITGLGVPYLSWVIVGMMVGWPVASPSSFGAVASRLRDALLGLGSGGGLWFLYALLCAAVIIWALRRWEWLLVAVTVVLLLKPWMPEILFVNQFRWVVLPFAVTGYLVGVHRPDRQSVLRWSLLAFPLLLLLMWPVIEQPHWVDALKSGLEVVWPVWLVRIHPDGVTNGIFWVGRYALGAAGIGLSLLAVKVAPDRVIRVLAAFGVASLGIYASHFMWQRWLLQLVPGLGSLGLFALSLGLAFGTAGVIARIPYVRTLLLGAPARGRA